MSKAEIQEQIEMAQALYDAAIQALPYMPLESVPYTEATAGRYLDELYRLRKRLNEPGKQ